MALTKISTAGVKDDIVTSAKIADDAVVQAAIADDAVDEARLQISNAGSNGQALTKQSGNTGGLTWATISAGISDVVSDTSPQLGGDLATNSNDIVFADADKAIFGAGTDLQIFSDGSTCFLKADDLRIRSAGNENYQTFAANGAVELYYDDSKKLETTSTGIEIRRGTSDTELKITAHNTTSQSRLLFVDSSGIDGNVSYDHNDRKLYLGTAASGGLEGDLVIDSSGNVGFGTSSPAYIADLNVANTTAYAASTVDTNQFQLRINNTGAGGVAGLLFATEPSSGNGGLAGIRSLAGGSGNSDLIFSVRSGSTLYEAMRINSDRELLIGTTSGLSPLTVTSASTAANDSEPVATFTTQGHCQLRLNGDANQWSVIALDGGGTASGDFIIYDKNNGTERMRIDSSGRILIGTTNNSNGHIAASKLAVQGSDLTIFKDAGGDNAGVDGYKLKFVTQSGSLGEIDVVSEGGGGPNGRGGALRFYTKKNNVSAAAERLRITNDGHVLIDNDSGRLKLGDGQDLEIYHNGTDSKIRSDGHPLKLESDAITLKAYANNDVALTTAINGAIELFYDNSKKFETTANGATVTGHISGAHGVMEQFFTVCDGSTIALASGNKTVENVTADMDLTSTFADIPGSTFTYTPPTGAKQVIFEFHYYGTFKDPNVIWHHKLFLDSDEVTMARGSFRANEAFTDRIVMKWAFNIGGTAATASGRVASWTGNKTIKMQAREFGSSSEAYLHRLANWDGSTTDVEAPDAAMPCIGITAIG